MKPIAPILLTALMLPGCAATGHGDPTDTCTSKDTCVVNVLVRGCSWEAIEVRPEELWVRRGYKGEVTWKLTAPPGWEFAKNGIEFKDAAGSREEFTESKHGAREFWWFDKNAKKGRHHYNINVVHPNGKVCTRDPTVMNDGDGP